MANTPTDIPEYPLPAIHTERRQRRLRVLLSAYACEPGKGSEPGNGWNWAREMSHYEEVWVLTRGNNRGAIEKELTSNPLANAHFHYFDLPTWARWWKKNSRGIRLYYYLWQICASFRAKRLHREIGFDIAHHVSFATYVFPTFLWRLRIPFVWGPVGGGESIPKSLSRSFGIRCRVEESLRSLRRCAAAADPFVSIAARRASIVAATTPETRTMLIRLRCKDVPVIPHAALSEADLRALIAIPPKKFGPFRVLSVGRLVLFKAFDLGLQAFALFAQTHPESEYLLIGDGPEKKRLHTLARSIGVASRVVFAGSQSRQKVFLALEQTDVVLFPSLHDSSGWAVVESMAAGRPVVCLDLGGPGQIVAPGRGIKVRAQTADQVVADLAVSLSRLAGDSAYRLALGGAAREYVQRYHSWSGIVSQFDAAYHRVLAEHPDGLLERRDLSVAIDRTRTGAVKRSAQIFSVR